MKKAMTVLVAATLAACAITVEAATGSSGWFFVDTTSNELKISDVTSKYFDGEYGGNTGRKSTFLNGTPCKIEMTIVMDDDSEVDHWLVNGSTVMEKTFKFDVGSLPVGGRLDVVAIGKKEGENSKAFRVNFDVAEHVGNAEKWAARPSNSGGIDEIVYTPYGGGLTLSFSPEETGTKPDNLNWLPGDEWSLAPKLELKPEVRSEGNGNFTSGTVGIGGNVNGSSVGGDTLKKMLSAGKVARVLDHDIGMSFTGGPIALSWNPNRRRWVAEEVSFTGEVNGSIGWTHYIPTTMGPVFVEGKLEAALAATFKVSGMSAGLGGLESSFVLSSDRLPKVSVAGGYGINNVANVKATISGMSVLEATHSKGKWTDVKWGLRGSGALTAKFLPFEATLFELTSDTLWIINSGASKSKSARLMSAAPAGGLDWRLQSRDYLATPKKAARLMAAPGGADFATVESGGYPEPAPAMVSGAKGDALAYLRDNAARSSANRTELVLRLGTSNVWGAAEAVWDDGTADFLPSLAAMPDGSVAAAWMNASRVFADGVTVDEFCAAEEIAVGIRNAVTGAWTCRNLTSDGAFDFSPVVRAAANGKVLVAWLRNASGKMASSAAEPTDIMAAVYSGGTWGAATVVRSGVGVVAGFDVAFDGENAVLAFSKDSDGNPSTVGDAEMYALRLSGGSWGEPAKLTASGDADGMPLVRVDGVGGFAVLWTAKGVLMETSNLVISNAVAVAAADGWTLPAKPVMIRGTDGRDALVWNDISKAGSTADAPTAMMYDPVCGAWGAPVKLFDDERRESRLSGAIGIDGGLRIGYESASVATNAAGEVSVGATEVRTRFVPAQCDLAVVEDGFSFSTDEFTDGEVVSLTVKAANLGFWSATDATVKVYEEKDDARTELASVVTNFPGGGVVALTVPWTVDNTQTNLKFTVEIDAGANGESEDAKDNNVYSWFAGTPDVSFGTVTVRNESATRRLLTVNVVNKGLGSLPAGAKVVFRRGGVNGEVIAEDTIGELRPGENGVYGAGFAWDIEGVAFTSEWETVCAQLFTSGTVGAALEADDMAFMQVMTTLNEQTQPVGGSYKVTFGKNGGAGGDNYVTATYGAPMPTPRTAPTQGGWAFGGYWDTIALDEKGNPKGKQYYDASMKSVRNWDKNSTGTLWAKWTNKVTLGKNGGTGGDSYVTCTKGQPMPKRTMPTKTGYVFDGYWTTTGAGGVKYYNADGTSAHAWDKGGNVTLWAKWEKAVSCKVTLGKNGGTGGDDYVTATTGQPMPTPRRAPAKSGWAFGGYWDTLACDAKGNPLGKQYYNAKMESVRNWDKTAPATLWAKWTVKVTLGKNGGTGGDNSVTVIYGQPFPTRTMPTKSGYAFGGYFVSASAKTGQCYNADGTGTSTMKWTTGGTPTIWALWTKTSACVELPPPVAPSASAASAPAALSIPTGIYSGVLAEGTGTFWLVLDEVEEGAPRTAFLYVASEDGAMTAECEVEEADGLLLLTTEDGNMYSVDLAAGIVDCYSVTR